VQQGNVSADDEGVDEEESPVAESDKEVPSKVTAKKYGAERASRRGAERKI
jgi:hypothetical protein